MTGSENMTKIKDHPAFSSDYITYDGMMSWAGTGPLGQRCAKCLYWGAGHKNRPEKATAKSGCQKWQEWFGKKAKPFPGMASACKYFEPTP